MGSLTQDPKNYYFAAIHSLALVIGLYATLGS